MRFSIGKLDRKMANSFSMLNRQGRPDAHDYSEEQREPGVRHHPPGDFGTSRRDQMCQSFVRLPISNEGHRVVSERGPDPDRDESPTGAAFGTGRVVLGIDRVEDLNVSMQGFVRIPLKETFIQ